MVLYSKEGPVRPSMFLYGMVRYGMVIWYGMVWYGHGMVWYGHGMVGRYGMVWSKVVEPDILEKSLPLPP